LRWCGRESDCGLLRRRRPESDEDGGLLFELSPALLTALTYASPSRLAEVAERWVEQRAEDGEEVDREVAREILGDVARLARNAGGRGMRVYCRVG